MTGESFEYAIKKDVRNNPIVREVDRERHREMWRSVTVGVFLVAVLVFSVWRQVELVRHGYELDDLQAARAAEDKTNQSTPARDRKPSIAGGHRAAAPFESCE